jgi:SMC interacting uncharacterized protein involved in chromosome segregation
MDANLLTPLLDEMKNRLVELAGKLSRLQGVVETQRDEIAVLKRQVALLTERSRPL